ncbi:prepilin-type cleavage/methylation domain-containing protein [Photobacterium sanctipauli]|uniref:Prepilin-type cleavage/methylation domain-containing protein n=1 Tax=Photobacterium sanctipauli TaxID=1342794 RepID=A0A2T3N9N1_9GAMM|nr:prepilin-type N-terminal cleavage/methylation domain-containing protein [Photobacterium sanctipauli]PSW10218.1 prepilin-type cleavage/methylation domain-containing protein [Photobacterium sanctipauli]
MKRYSQRGFTLIEGVITIVILGVAMVTLTSFLFPQAERSATPYYQARSAAIGNAFLNEILSRKFDEHSDPFGDSLIRCGETVRILGVDYYQDCSQPIIAGNNYRWPEDDPAEYYDYVDPLSGNTLGRGLKVEMANDVDDFHGCWGDLTLCNERNFGNRGTYPWRGFIESLIEPESSNAKNDYYKNITVNVKVSYPNDLNIEQPPRQHKRIEVVVDAGNYGKYDFVAIRSNY